MAAGVCVAEGACMAGGMHGGGGGGLCGGGGILARGHVWWGGACMKSGMCMAGGMHATHAPHPATHAPSPTCGQTHTFENINIPLIGNIDIFKVCSHLTFAFASTSPSKFNIASMETQTQTYRMGLNPFLTFCIDVDANANVKCEHTFKLTDQGTDCS